ELEREADLIAQLSGLTKSYNDDLKRLQSSRAKGNITEAQYVSFVEALIAKQPFAIAQAKTLAEGYKQIADAEARGMQIREQY
ncbi:hypothetical protein, partial [Streptococcus pneumoniae]|uniref:hypothetical protein n=1 Tax=Streptococcus pneumoniae TaxID=1313 RepID=UPI0018B0F42D